MIRLRLTGTTNLGYEFMLAEKLFSLGARPPIVRAVCHTALQGSPSALTPARHAAIRSLLGCAVVRT